MDNMKKRKLRENLHYRVRWGNFKSDKWKKKSLLMAEVRDLIAELYHPFVSRKQIIALKDQLKEMLYSDAGENFNSLTLRQMHDFWDLGPKQWKEKWGDKI